jgi:hypothetical protein
VRAAPCTGDGFVRLNNVPPLIAMHATLAATRPFRQPSALYHHGHEPRLWATRKGSVAAGLVEATGLQQICHSAASVPATTP